MDARRGGRHQGNHSHRHGGHDGHRRFQRGGGRGGGGHGGGRGRGGGNFHHNHHAAGGRGSFWFKGDGYNDFENVSIDEEVVGIHGYLTPDQPGFPGLVKQRYSDFIVRELPLNGSHEPVALTALVTKKRTLQANVIELLNAFVFGGSDDNSGNDVPLQREPGAFETQKLLRHLAREVAQLATARSKRGQEAQETYNLRKLISLVNEELGAKMGGEFAAFMDKVKARRDADREMLAAGVAVGEPNAMEEQQEKLEFYIGGFNEKRDRVFIHETMRRYGKAWIVADTITSPDQSQVIRVRQLPLSGPRKGERDPRKEWPVDRPEYLQFVIYKKNKDLQSIINQISTAVKVNANLFSFAEVKDKRGITSQLCTAHRIAKERFQVFARQSTKNLDDQSYVVGNLKYTAKKLSLGDCRGNAYSIVVRGVPDVTQLSARMVETAVDQWKTRGFTNFYGIQRFGSSTTPNHILGRAMLRKDFKLAVLLLLRPQDGEATKVRQAREHFKQHKDVAAALRMLPPFLIPERAVLEGLLQHGMDANELAFRNIPVHLRIAYVEAYQFYVWNQMASMRLEQYSRTKAIVGDLVLDHSEGTDGSVESPRSRQRVVVLTEETVDNYSIDDVVLPLPGYSVTYPANDLGAAYHRMLSMDGVDFGAWESLTQSANHHPYDVKGSYRNLVCKPRKVTYELKDYSDVTQPLLLNDLDVLQGRTAPPEFRPAQERRYISAAPNATTPVPDRSQPETSGEAEKKAQPGRALILHFQLDYGCDATIAVRELLKQSTSMHVQMQLADNSTNPNAAKAATGQESGDTTATGKKRPSSTVLPGAKAKEARVVTAKKSQVAIGRPGFSLGKC